ncbi:MAG: PAS domain S-box protein [Desulfobacterales bacterium]|nr:PAS domain S-box protein [Desulfobacterales bacterium]
MAADTDHKALLEKIKALENEAAARKEAEAQLKKQSAFLNSVLESLDHPFYVVDAKDYTIKLANTAALKSGASGASTCHALSHNRSTPCDSSEHTCPLEIIKKSKKPVQVEHVHYDSQGRPRNVEVHGHPIFDRNGHVTQMIEYSFDITERKQIEATIRESETKFRRVAESAKDAIITADRNGKIVFCNSAAAEMFGHPADSLIGQSISILMPQRFREAHERGMAKVVASGTSKLIGETVELFGITKDGKEFPVELSLSTWQSGAEQFYTGMIRDISERKLHEKELNSLISSLKESLAQVRQLSGMLPICASCKKIRDDKGYWNQIEEYIRSHSEAEFSHGICPECSQKLYPQYHQQLKANKDQ